MDKIGFSYLTIALLSLVSVSLSMLFWINFLHYYFKKYLKNRFTWKPQIALIVTIAIVVWIISNIMLGVAFNGIIEEIRVFYLSIVIMGMGSSLLYFYKPLFVDRDLNTELRKNIDLKIKRFKIISIISMNYLGFFFLLNWIFIKNYFEHSNTVKNSWPHFIYFGENKMALIYGIGLIILLLSNIFYMRKKRLFILVLSISMFLINLTSFFLTLSHVY